LKLGRADDTGGVLAGQWRARAERAERRDNLIGAYLGATRTFRETGFAGVPDKAKPGDFDVVSMSIIDLAQQMAV
jgi:hypothetical protein